MSFDYVDLLVDLIRKGSYFYEWLNILKSRMSLG